MPSTPAPLNAGGVVEAPDFVARVRRSVRVVREQGRALDLAATDFDTLFFGRSLTPFGAPRPKD